MTTAQIIDTEPYRVSPGTTASLNRWTTNDDGGFDKSSGQDATTGLNERIEHLQEMLWAEHKHKVLIVIQATDTGGKDGTIRHVFDGVNPQGVKVASFKKPTEKELAHDYLWRIHAETPGAGEIVLFNRSHYEDVLVVRVHGFVPEERWRRRYEHIRNFVQLLVDEGTTIIKLFLHISKEEQKERLQERLDVPEKNWKFSASDIEERKKWDDYQIAFADMLNETSTEDAPWYVIPADRKWFRNLLISQVVADTLESLDMAYPDAEQHLEDIVIDD